MTEHHHVYSLAEIAELLPWVGGERAVRSLIRWYQIPHYRIGPAAGLDDRQLGQLLEATIAPAMAASNLRALGEGANAARAGKPRSDNPWPWYRPEHANWNEGWDYTNRTRESGR